MKISIIGTGYVGLVTGLCLAEVGHQVIGVDIDESKVQQLNQGIPTIFEAGLEELLSKHVQKKTIQFTTNLTQAVQETDVIFLALPTPEHEDGSADLKYVLEVAHQMGPLIQSYKIIVNKSTVPVGTAQKVKDILEQHTSNFDVVSNPEFLKEGYAIEDALNPERIVIGTSSLKAEEVMRAVYTPFTEKGVKLIAMDIASAELTKYAANTFLATKITFMNEMANICERVGADIEAIKRGIGDDSRIGSKFLNAGIGYGGSCFPKDVKALIKSSQLIDYDFKIGQAVDQVNDLQRIHFLTKIKDYFQNLEGLTFAVWGLSFKPGTDDIRKAPALDGVQFLLDHKAKVQVYDPVALENFKGVFKDQISYYEDLYSVLEGADALIIFTEWKVFQQADVLKIKHNLKQPIMFDGRNLYDLQTMKHQGFYYQSVGRPLVN